MSLDKSGYRERDALTATVRAHYNCLIPLFCPSGLDMTADSSLVYQGAAYIYEFNVDLSGILASQLGEQVESATQDAAQDTSDSANPRPPAANNQPNDANGDTPQAAR